MRVLAVSVVISAVLAGAAFAQGEAPAAAVADTAAASSPAPEGKKEGEKKKDAGVICRRERVVGSNRPIRVCTTAEERAMAKGAAGRLIDSRAQTSADAN